MPTTPYQVKPLNDSCYVVPEKNFRVIQDDDPAKNTAWMQALQRHEKDVMQTKRFNQTVMNNFYRKINQDWQDLDDENTTRKKQQQHQKHELSNQMQNNVNSFGNDGRNLFNDFLCV